MSHSKGKGRGSRSELASLRLLFEIEFILVISKKWSFKRTCVLLKAVWHPQTEATREVAEGSGV